jgi:hypothetical protein
LLTDPVPEYVKDIVRVQYLYSILRDPLNDKNYGKRYEAYSNLL